MSQLDWAKRECEIAYKRENPDWDGKSFDYGCNCYQSALKAFESLCKDEHSGASWGITTHILEKLMRNQPLSPIEDIKEDWNLCSEENGIKTYQNKRMSSLFKDVSEDGDISNISFNDVERVAFYEFGNNWSSHYGRASRLVDELYPISMPYVPDLKKFVVEGFLFDSEKAEKGVYNTSIITSVTTPGGFKRKVLVCDGDTENGWGEIKVSEALRRLGNYCAIINDDTALEWLMGCRNA